MTSYLRYYDRVLMDKECTRRRSVDGGNFGVGVKRDGDNVVIVFPDYHDDGTSAATLNRDDVRWLRDTLTHLLDG